MENKNYSVNRKDIYVGEVVKASAIVRYNGADTYEISNQDLIANPFQKLRSCLFVPREDELSVDLLYKCPNYPILNYTFDQNCLNLRDRVVIRRFYKLEDLLIHLKYGETLNINDVLKIRNTLFSGRYAKDNPGLFGLKEVIPDDYVAYKNGEVSTDYYYRLRNYRKEIDLLTKRSFIKNDKDGILPEYVMNLIDEYGNRQMLSGEIIDSFASVPGEGKVKKLIKN